MEGGGAAGICTTRVVALAPVFCFTNLIATTMSKQQREDIKALDKQLKKLTAAKIPTALKTLTAEVDQLKSEKKELREELDELKEQVKVEWEAMRNACNSISDATVEECEGLRRDANKQAKELKRLAAVVSTHDEHLKGMLQHPLKQQVQDGLGEVAKVASAAKASLAATKSLKADLEMQLSRLNSAQDHLTSTLETCRAELGEHMKATQLNAIETRKCMIAFARDLSNISNSSSEGQTVIRKQMVSVRAELQDLGRSMQTELHQEVRQLKQTIIQELDSVQEVDFFTGGQHTAATFSSGPRL